MRKKSKYFLLIAMMLMAMLFIGTLTVASAGFSQLLNTTDTDPATDVLDCGPNDMSYIPVNASATALWFWAGPCSDTTYGGCGDDYFSSGEIPIATFSGTQTFTGLPGDGSIVWFTAFEKVSGIWVIGDQTSDTAATGCLVGCGDSGEYCGGGSPDGCFCDDFCVSAGDCCSDVNSYYDMCGGPAITSHTGGDEICNGDVVTWTANGAPVSSWYLWAGPCSDPSFGGCGDDYFNSGPLPPGTLSIPVSGIPSNAPVTLRLWFNMGGAWDSVVLPGLDGCLSPCDPGQVEDCNGNCYPASWVGDTVCDDGPGVDFMCPQFNFDEGDCIGKTCDVDKIYDCINNCENAAWLGDGFCDNDTADVLPGLADFTCINDDNGDCQGPAITSHTGGDEICNGDVVTWTANGAPVSSWYLWAGPCSDPSFGGCGDDYFNSGPLPPGTLSIPVSGIPSNAPVTLRLWFNMGGAWDSVVLPGLNGCPSLCDPGQVEDCNGNCNPASWVGDTVCDDGPGIDFMCPQFNFDEGDCIGKTCDVNKIYDCTNNCENASWLGDGTCDDDTGNTDPFLADFTCINDDNGDCQGPVIYNPPNNSVLCGNSVTFDWMSNGVPVTQYWLWVGNTGVGSSNYYTASQGTNTSVTLLNWPADGSTIYIRLYYTTSGSPSWPADWDFTDHQYVDGAC